LKFLSLFFFHKFALPVIFFLHKSKNN
jgi:hypothetical protein